MGDQSEYSIFEMSSYSDADNQPSLLVPIVRATPETLAGFGKLVPDYDAEHVTCVTWPHTGWRSIFPGTGNLQVRVTSSLGYWASALFHDEGWKMAAEKLGFLGF